MKKFFLFLLVLIFSVVVGLKIKTDPGVMFLSWHHWSVEMPLWLAALLWLASYVILSIVLRLFRMSSSFLRNFSRLLRKRQAERAREATEKGLLKMAECDWRQAEKALIKGTLHNSNPLINYLMAAEAAENQSAPKRRDNYLRLAHECAPDADLAIGLTQAQLQFSHHQYEQALATLTRLRMLSPKHPFVLKLLLKLYRQLGDYAHWQAILPDCRRYAIISNEEYDAMEMECLLAKIKNDTARSEKAFELLWDAIPRKWRHHPALVEAYAQKLVAYSYDADAEKIVRETLKNQWDPNLIALYGKIASDHPDKQLSFVESLLKQHAENPALLCAAGRICIRAQLWGKARSYLESSLRFAENAETRAALGHLLEQLGEKTAAFHIYQQGYQSYE